MTGTNGRLMPNLYGDDGICCPTCGSVKSTIVDTRFIGGSKVRRRRCPSAHRYKTIESAIDMSLKDRRLVAQIKMLPKALQASLAELLRELVGINAEGQP